MYYDLTGTETAALMKGVSDRNLASMRQTRILATLLRNAYFKGAVSETDYMPLPGDADDFAPVSNQSPEAMLAALASAMGITPEIEVHGPEF